ncbi:ANTAR domain-containing protein [Rhizobiales bacterium]|uniref:ANTAR domain-containing response regulator n=1 Tax=Hongsoonwoonella zoysiae TaxID=2821844 RepID=UPI001560DE67|nr:ANTAR domain-containing protein [Hongsoonwoonella zoysiae]NRG16241.1 ANTAR domain-containing protein [Hongsoonwoonella zoysiae]
MSRFRLPNFSGQRAMVVHPEDANTKLLTEQLRKLGLRTETSWPAHGIKVDDFDVLFFDADRGCSEQFRWEPGASPIPLIALLGSEAPGRIEWTLSQMPAAYILKPVRSTGVFSALAIAFHNYEYMERMQRKIADLGDRLRARPLVTEAIQMLAVEFGLGNSDAYRVLRTQAMRKQVSVEALCEQIVASRSLAPLHWRGDTAESR